MYVTTIDKSNESKSIDGASVWQPLYNTPHAQHSMASFTTPPCTQMRRVSRVERVGNADPMAYLGGDGQQYGAVVATETLVVDGLR